MLWKRLALLVATMVTALVLASGAALAAAIIGTPGDDRLVGTPGADSIIGLAGSDTIYTNGGDDTVSGGAGQDDLIAERPDFSTPRRPGHVTMEGGPGFDIFWTGGAQKATLSGGRGPEDFQFAPTDGNDIISGGPGHDRYLGGYGGDDVLSGGPGDDNVWKPGDGTDKVYGGPGDDALVESYFDVAYASGTDILSGGRGDDGLAVRNTPAKMDIVSCGRGLDRVEADRKDIVADDCEKVFYRFNGLLYYGF